MVEGGLDGGFFAIYTPQGPLTPEGRALVKELQARFAGVAKQLAADLKVKVEPRWRRDQATLERLGI